MYWNLDLHPCKNLMCRELFQSSDMFGSDTVIQKSDLFDWTTVYNKALCLRYTKSGIIMACFVERGYGASVRPTFLTV